MKKNLLLFSSLFLMVLSLHAKVWRVNNNANARADFASLQLAASDVSVLNDDTIYIEGSSTQYSSTFTMTKRLVVIGTGYLLSGSGANTGLQANTNAAIESGSIFLDSLASGSKFIGFAQGSGGYFYINPRTDNITLERSQVQLYFSGSAATAFNRCSNWVINKCYVTYWLWPAAFYAENLTVTNCIFTGTYSVATGNFISALVRNNTYAFGGSGVLNVGNAYFANNIISGVTSADLSTSTVKNCVATTNILPAGNGNQNSIAAAAIFVGLAGNSTDGQYQLRAGSPAIGAGETVSSVTPDCGAFGTADPYRLSGIPPIPTIYSLTVPTTVPSSNTSMSVTISARSNN